MASSRTAAGSGGFCRRRDTRRTSRSHRLCTPRPLPPLGMAGLPTLTPPRGVPALPRGDGRDRPLPHPAAGFPGHSSSAACCRSTRWRVSPLLAMPPGWGAGPGGVDGGAGVPLRSRGRGEDPASPGDSDARPRRWLRPRSSARALSFALAGEYAVSDREDGDHAEDSGEPEPPIRRALEGGPPPRSSPVTVSAFADPDNRLPHHRPAGETRPGRGGDVRPR